MSGKKKLYFIFNKPYKVLSQFSDEAGNQGLGSLLDLPRDVYPVGRLDLDSEGLLLLTNDRRVNHLLLDPKHRHQRTYWVEVEGQPDRQALEQLSSGVTIKVKGTSYRTEPCQAQAMTEVKVEQRDPPVNHRKYPVTSWLEIKLIEGKNRQVRKMTAAVGHPTLRLIRVAIEDLFLFPLPAGELRQLAQKTLFRKLRLD